MKHGGYGTRLYSIWRNMIQRCENKKAVNYDRYGGIGVSVCDEWHIFVNFRDWALASGYSDSLTLDRKKSDGGYCPENCRWATMKTQQNNRRNNHLVTYNGETHTLSEWAEKLGTNYFTIAARLRCGWNEEDAVSIPLQKKNRRKKE